MAGKRVFGHRLFRRRRSRAEFEKEIETHLELETERLIDEGLPPDEARWAARRTFGNVATALERFEEARGWLWIDHLAADVRASCRSLAKYPVACAVAIVSLAGGIGAATSALAVRDAVFRKPPLLYHAPERLSRVQVGTRERPIQPLGSQVPGPLLQIWRDGSHVRSIAASVSGGTRQVKTANSTQTVGLRSVTPEFFEVLGVRPVIGETFSDRPHERGDVVVLSHKMWHLLFDGRWDVVGQEVWIEHRAHTVIGVLPPQFWFASMDSPLWTRLDLSALASVTGLDVVMRRPADVTPQQLADRLEPGLVEYVSRLPVAERSHYLKVSGIEGTPLGGSVTAALPYLLGGSVLLTLLIACANVAILVIAQWTAREQEIAIRAALGGSRARIVRLLITESVVIAGAGGLLGISAAAALVGVVTRNAGDMVGFFDLSIDATLLLQSAIITVLSGAIAGLGPALFETRRLHGNPLRAMTSSDRVRQRWRNLLVAMEISVTVALLVAAATMLDGYRRSLTADLGFSTDRLLAVRVENSAGVDISRIVESLERLRGVSSAAASTAVPYAEFGGRQQVASERSGRTITAERGAVGAGFFETLGVRLVAGRAFTGEESPAGRVAIVNEMLASRLWPGGNPLGRFVWLGGAAYEVVGVVADYKNSAFQDPDWAPKMFVPLDSSSEAKAMRFLVRCSGDAAAVLRTLRRDLELAAPGHMVSRAYTIQNIIAIGGQEILVGTAPLVPLIATGVLLTAAGIYGVLAFAVARRSKELAVRLALGASGGDVVRLVAAHSTRLVAIGAAFGVGGTYALTRLVRASGGADGMFDPNWTAFVAPAAVIVLVGTLASWIPSRRALKVNPTDLLRMT